MYQIFINGNQAQLTDFPLFIIPHPNGGNIPIDPTDPHEVRRPTGVMVNGVAYPLPGGEADYPDTPQAVIQRIPGGASFIAEDVAFVAAMQSTPLLSRLDEQQRAIAETHLWLRRELAKGYTWEDGNTYTITADKQSYMASKLADAHTEIIAGTDPEDVKVYWNKSGDVDAEWMYGDFAALHHDIQAHIEPLIQAQQQAELEVREAFAKEPEQEGTGIIETVASVLEALG